MGDLLPPWLLHLYQLKLDMLPPAVQESNIAKVLQWLNEDHSRYPVVGQRAMEAATVLGVTSAEVNIANRRIRFGLEQLQIIPPRPIKPVKTIEK